MVILPYMTQTQKLTTREAWELVAQSFIENVEFEGKYGPTRMYPSYSTGICSRLHFLYLIDLLTEDQYEAMLAPIKEHLPLPSLYLSMNSDREVRSLFCLLLAEQMENE